MVGMKYTNKKIAITKNLASNNSIGNQGISFDRQNNRWIASWCENQKQKNKHFPVYAYASSEAAKQSAIDYREQMVNLFYNAPSQQ